MRATTNETSLGYQEGKEIYRQWATSLGICGNFLGCVFEPPKTPKTLKTFRLRALFPKRSGVIHPPQLRHGSISIRSLHGSTTSPARYSFTLRALVPHRLMTLLTPIDSFSGGVASSFSLAVYATLFTSFKTSFSGGPSRRCHS